MVLATSHCGREPVPRLPSGWERVGGDADSGATTLDITDQDILAIAGGANEWTLVTIGDAGVAGTEQLTVDGGGATPGAAFRNNLVLNSAGVGGGITIAGNLTNTAIANRSITLNGTGATTNLNADILTAGGAVVINDALLVNGTRKIDTTNGGATPGGGNVTFNGAINGANNSPVGGVDDLAVSGNNVVVNFAVGAITPLRDLNISAAEIDLLSGAGTIHGTRNLILRPGTSAATAIRVGGDADSGATTLDITDQDILAIAGGANEWTLVTIGDAGVDGTEQLTVDGGGATPGAAFRNHLVLNSAGAGGKITIDGNLTNTLLANRSIQLNGTGSTTNLNADIITAGGAIEINDAVVVNGSRKLDSTGAGVPAGASITVNGTINGKSSPALGVDNLDVNAGTAGPVLLRDAIGHTIPLHNLNVTGGGGITLKGGEVTTTGDQKYHGALSLDATANTTSLTGANLEFDSTVRSVTANEEHLILLATGTVSPLGSAVPPGVVTARGTVTFLGKVGDANRALASLDVTANDQTDILPPLLNDDQRGLIMLNGGEVTPAGTQMYRSAVTLNAPVIPGDQINSNLTRITGSAITFEKTLRSETEADPNGPEALILRATGTSTLPGSEGVVTFLGRVGDNGQRLSLLDVTADANPLIPLDPTAQGRIEINGGEVTTTGDQKYHSAVRLNATADTTTLKGANVKFDRTVRSVTANEETLVVLATGTISPLGSAVPPGVVTARGTVTFSGKVGDANRALASLDVTANDQTDIPPPLNDNQRGLIILNGGEVTTAGTQMYHSAVTLNAPVIPGDPINSNLTRITGSAITFDKTLRSETEANPNGPEALILRATGTSTGAGSEGVATFLGRVGDNGQRLSLFDVTADANPLNSNVHGRIQINGASVATTGTRADAALDAGLTGANRFDQRYRGDVFLNAPANADPALDKLTTLAGNHIAFGSDAIAPGTDRPADGTIRGSADGVEKLSITARGTATGIGIDVAAQKTAVRFGNAVGDAVNRLVSLGVTAGDGTLGAPGGRIEIRGGNIATAGPNVGERTGVLTTSSQKYTTSTNDLRDGSILIDARAVLDANNATLTLNATDLPLMGGNLVRNDIVLGGGRQVG
ncbi:MAG: hypothetical protein NT069_18835 [Planctomycetota bacterium]|nr:hypothetical protein [Planctomycetota bacterium]